MVNLSRARKQDLSVIGYLSGRSPAGRPHFENRFLSRSKRPASTSAETSPSNTAIRKAAMIRYRSWHLELVRQQVAALVATDNSSARGRQGRDLNHSHRVWHRRRSRQTWPRGEPQPSGRQCYRRLCVYVAIGSKALELDPRAAAHAGLHRIRGQSKQPIHGAYRSRRCSKRQHNRAATTCVAREKRSRGRGGVFHHGAAKTQRSAIRRNGTVSGHQ